MNYYPNYYQQQQNNNNGLIWVSGEAGAKAYPVAPNTTVQLWDSESQSIYLKSADNMGMPSIKILDYTIRDNAPTRHENSLNNDYLTKDDILSIEDKIKALESKIQKIEEGKKDE